jgi:hypothetical protein
MTVAVAVDATWVALAATIGGSIVALAGVAVGAWTTSVQRRQAVELAEAQHEHERKLAQGERLFERRASVYEAMIGNVHALMEHVEAREPLTSSGEPSLPPKPSIAEQRAMQSKLRTIGSAAVADALDRLAKAARNFFVLASTVGTIRDQGGKFEGEIEQMLKAREEARAATLDLERLVSEELSSL